MSVESKKPAMDREVWTVNDVAEYLGLHPKTVTAKAKKGQIPGVQIGSVWRFSRDRIRAFVCGGSAQSGENEGV